MKRLGRIAKYLAGAIYAVCGLAMLTFMVPATGLQAKTVTTGSMRPAIPTGSLVIIQRTPVSHLAVGNVVTYRKSPGSSTTITHRIVAVEQHAGIPYFVTKGDANAGPDLPIPGGAIIGKVVWHVPYLGTIANSIKTPVALLLLVMLPGLIIIVAESHRLRQLLRPAAAPTVVSSPAESAAVPMPPDRPVPITQAAPHPRRGLDGMTTRKLVAGGLALGLLSMLGLGVGVTRAATTTNSVQLTGTHLAVAASPGPQPSPHPSSGPCPDVTLDHTGPGSINVVTCTATSSQTVTNTNNVGIINSTRQTTMGH